MQSLSIDPFIVHLDLHQLAVSQNKCGSEMIMAIWRQTLEAHIVFHPFHTPQRLVGCEWHESSLLLWIINKSSNFVVLLVILEFILGIIKKIHMHFLKIPKNEMAHVMMCSFDKMYNLLLHKHKKAFIHSYIYIFSKHLDEIVSHYPALLTWRISESYNII